MNTITSEQIEAYRVPIPQGRILHGSAMVDELIKMRDEGPELSMGYATKAWPVLDEVYRIIPSSLLVGTGDSGVGKTTFFLAWILNLAKSGVGVGLCTLEDSWREVARKIAGMIAQKPPHKFQDADISFVADILEKLPLWFLDVRGPQREEFIHKAIQLMANKKGVKAVMIDHLDYISKKSERWQSESYVIGDCMRRLAGLAYETKTGIMLIAHPKKTDLKGFKDREIGMDELKGSSSIKQEASAVCGLWRFDSDSTNVAVRFQKIRSSIYSQNRGAFVRFSYDPEKSQFVELSTKPEWGAP